MSTLRKLFTSALDTLTSRMTDKDIEALQDSVHALDYELSLLRYKDSGDEDIRLACEYLRRRPFSAPLFPYEKLRNMPPADVRFDKPLKMCYVLHNGRPLYFPKGEKEKIVRWLYRFAIEDDDILGAGYRERYPHAYLSARYHIEAGDVLIDAGGWTVFDKLDETLDEVVGELVNDLIDDVIDRVGEDLPLHRRGQAEGEEAFGMDVGSPRGLLALDVIDKVGKVYLVERAPRWWKPLEATFAPYADKVELVKGGLSSKKIVDKKKNKIALAELLEKCGERRVFVTLDTEGDILDILSEAKACLKAARNPVILAVCAYHRTTDEADLLRFFEEIGYHTEIQPGYIYTNMNDGHGIHSLRRGIIRASNRP